MVDRVHLADRAELRQGLLSDADGVEAGAEWIIPERVVAERVRILDEERRGRCIAVYHDGLDGTRTAELEQDIAIELRVLRHISLIVDAIEEVHALSYAERVIEIGHVELRMVWHGTGRRVVVELAGVPELVDLGVGVRVDVFCAADDGYLRAAVDERRVPEPLRDHVAGCVHFLARLVEVHLARLRRGEIDEIPHAAQLADREALDEYFAGKLAIDRLGQGWHLRAHQVAPGAEVAHLLVLGQVHDVIADRVDELMRKRSRELCGRLLGDDRLFGRDIVDGELRVRNGIPVLRTGRNIGVAFAYGNSLAGVVEREEFGRSAHAR